MAFDLSQLLMGTPEGSRGVSLGYTPEQQQGISQLLQSGLGGLKDPSAGFEPIAERARSNFEKRTMPSLINRVAALGSGRSGSYDRLAQLAGSDFEEALNAQRAEYGLRNQGQMLDLARLGLTRQFEQDKTAAQPGLLQQLAAGHIGRLGQAGEEGGLSSILQMLTGPQDASWTDIIGKSGQGAITGGGFGGPIGAAVGAVIPLLLRLLTKES